LDSHVDATLRRLASVPLVLAVQDTTELDWSTHPATTGLGPLGHPAQRGLHVHTTLAFTPERVPLGLLAQQVWARDPNTVGKAASQNKLTNSILRNPVYGGCSKTNDQFVLASLLSVPPASSARLPRRKVRSG